MKSISKSTVTAILTALVALAVLAMAQQKSTDGKIQIFATDRPITEVISMIPSASAYNYNADPGTLEVSGLLAECHKPNVVITSDPNAADYVLDFWREGGKRSTFFAKGGLTGLGISAASKVDHAA